MCDTSRMIELSYLGSSRLIPLDISATGKVWGLARACCFGSLGRRLGSLRRMSYGHN